MCGIPERHQIVSNFVLVLFPEKRLESVLRNLDLGEFEKSLEVGYNDAIKVGKWRGRKAKKVVEATLERVLTQLCLNERNIEGSQLR